MIVDLSSHLATNTARWGALQTRVARFFISFRSSLTHPVNYFLLWYPTKIPYVLLPGFVPVEPCPFFPPSLSFKSKKEQNDQIQGGKGTQQSGTRLGRRNFNIPQYSCFNFSFFDDDHSSGKTHSVADGRFFQVTIRGSSRPGSRVV
jgi:hypothetical protein